MKNAEVLNSKIITVGDKAYLNMKLKFLNENSEEIIEISNICLHECEVKMTPKVLKNGIVAKYEPTISFAIENIKDVEFLEGRYR